jgi:cytoskeletal protein CcmA (bactofilin family)
MNMNKKIEAINSIVAQATTFKGEITSEGSLHVAGELIGSVKVKNDVFVMHQAKVVGDIEGSRIVISGSVDGNIIAEKGLEILKTGRVNGEITCHHLIIEEGSFYQGKVNVNTTETANV